jgi:hypothetical protein
LSSSDLTARGAAAPNQEKAMVTRPMPTETKQLSPFTCSLAAATELSGLSRSTLLRRADAGDLKTVVVSSRRLVVVESLKQLLGLVEDKKTAW